jgi:hypothetical protein
MGEGKLEDIHRYVRMLFDDGLRLIGQNHNTERPFYNRS